MAKGDFEFPPSNKSKPRDKARRKNAVRSSDKWSRAPEAGTLIGHVAIPRENEPIVEPARTLEPRRPDPALGEVIDLQTDSSKVEPALHFPEVDSTPPVLNLEENLEILEHEAKDMTPERRAKFQQELLDYIGSTQEKLYALNRKGTQTVTPAERKEHAETLAFLRQLDSRARRAVASAEAPLRMPKTAELPDEGIVRAEIEKTPREKKEHLEAVVHDLTTILAEHQTKSQELAQLKRETAQADKRDPAQFENNFKRETRIYELEKETDTLLDQGARGNVPVEPIPGFEEAVTSASVTVTEAPLEQNIDIPEAVQTAGEPKPSVTPEGAVPEVEKESEPPAWAGTVLPGEESLEIREEKKPEAIAMPEPSVPGASGLSDIQVFDAIDAPERLVPAKTSFEKPKNDDEWKERREKLARQFAEQVGLEKERESMLKGEQEYLDAEHAFYAKKGNGMIERAAQRFLGTEEYRQTVGATYARYNNAAVEFEKKLEDRLSERLMVATKGMDATEAKEYAEKFSKRYRRMVVTKDTIDHGEERLRATREKALNEQEKNALEKGLVWAARQNQQLEDKLGKKGARAIRVIASATIGAGIATIAAPASAVFGLSAFGVRLARGFAGAFGGAFAGARAGERYEQTLGAKSKGKLLHARETAALDTASMIKRRDAYRKGSTAAIDQNRKRIEAVTAILAGAGFSLGTGEALAANGAVQSAVETVKDLAEHGGGAFADQNEKLLDTIFSEKPNLAGVATPHVSVMPTNEVFSPTTHDQSMETPAHTTPAFSSPLVTPVEAKAGLGYEYMAKSFKTHLEQAHYNAPPGSDAEKLLSAKTAVELNKVVHDIAREHHFLEHPKVLLGSKMTVDSHGNLLFDQGGHGHAAVEAPPEAPKPVLPKPEVATPTEVPASPPVPEEIRLADPFGREPVIIEEHIVSTPETAVSADSAQVPEQAAVSSVPVTPFENKLYHVKINPQEVHVYQDTQDNMVVYGKDWDSQFTAAQQFAKAHKGVSVFLESKVPVLFEGRPQSWLMEVRYDGLFGGMHISPTPPVLSDGEYDPAYIHHVDPETFTKEVQST